MKKLKDMIIVLLISAGLGLYPQIFDYLNFFQSGAQPSSVFGLSIQGHRDIDKKNEVPDGNNLERKLMIEKIKAMQQKKEKEKENKEEQKKQTPKDREEKAKIDQAERKARIQQDLGKIESRQEKVKQQLKVLEEQREKLKQKAETEPAKELVKEPAKEPVK